MSDEKTASSSALPVGLSVQESRDVLRTLEAVVVSLHEILDLDRDPGNDDALRTYLSDGRAWRRLSRARRIMSVAVDRSLGTDASVKLVSGVRYWDGQTNDSWNENKT